MGSPSAGDPGAPQSPAAEDAARPAETVSFRYRAQLGRTQYRDVRGATMSTTSPRTGGTVPDRRQGTMLTHMVNEHQTMALTLGGISFLLGVVVVAWPGVSIGVLAVLIGLQLIINGVVRIAQSVVRLASPSAPAPSWPSSGALALDRRPRHAPPVPDRCRARRAVRHVLAARRHHRSRCRALGQGPARTRPRTGPGLPLGARRNRRPRLSGGQSRGLDLAVRSLADHLGIISVLVTLWIRYADKRTASAR